MWPEVFDQRAQAALRLADALAGPTGTLEQELLAELRERFDERERAELILVAGQANLNNRVGNAAKQVLGEPTAG